MIVHWVASSTPEPASSSGTSKPDADGIELDRLDEKKGKHPRKKKAQGRMRKARASLLQELVGIAVIVFGGETSLCESLPIRGFCRAR